MPVSASFYPPLLASARRHARRADEAEDIVQDVLIAALRAGRSDFSQPANRRWMQGAIRKRATFDARSAVRRLRREACLATDRTEMSQPAADMALADLLDGLPKSLRVVAALALSGHNKAEIAHLLDLNDAALRQRIHALKKTFAAHERIRPAGTPGLNGTLAYGRIRAALGLLLRQRGGRFASHDPDGHLIVFRPGSQKR